MTRVAKAHPASQTCKGVLLQPRGYRRNCVAFNRLGGPLVTQKNPRVRKIRVRTISGAGNGCANFMDIWKKCVLSAGKTMSVKFLLFRGGFGGGGGKCRFYFYGRADFSE